MQQNFFDHIEPERWEANQKAQPVSIGIVDVGYESEIELIKVADLVDQDIIITRFRERPSVYEDKDCFYEAVFHTAKDGEVFRTYFSGDAVIRKLKNFSASGNNSPIACRVVLRTSKRGMQYYDLI